MRNVIASLACLLPLAACVQEQETRVAAPPAAPPAAWATLAERVPENLGAFRRGVPNALPEGAPGRELPFATGDRAIAGYVQIRPDGQADAAADLTRQVQEATQAGPPHRRLRERARPPAADALHCAELDGTFGRQAVESLACSVAIAGNMVRIRLTMQRREGRLDQARGFARDMVQRLNAT